VVTQRQPVRQTVIFVGWRGVPVIRVLLVLNRPLFRGALASALAGEQDLDVVGEYDSTCQLGGTAADVAVVDVDALDHHGGPAPSLFGPLQIGSVVVLTAERVYKTPRCAVADWVRGLVAKDRGVETLVDTVRRVAAGERVMEPAPPGNPLTDRELEVLRMAADGLPSTTIADDLNLTVGTVQNYISAIVRKTGSRNRLEAVRAANLAGWL